MKRKWKFFFIILAAVIIFPAYTAPISDTDESIDTMTQSCPHNTLYKFDEESKTLKGVYEGNRVEALLSDIAFVGDSAVIMYNGEAIAEGELQEGMVVQIYHDNVLFGEYVIDALLEPFAEIPLQNAPSDGLFDTNSLMAASANTYGFILPIDGMNLTSDISQDFGGNHRGIDIGKPNGTPIRAMAAGTVVGYLAWNPSMGYENVNSWGNYIKIDHGNGYTTLYAHMKYTPEVGLNQWVSQGQIIGYVGNTGNVDPMPTPANPTAGSHLHLEVTVHGTLQNPITYLTGAPSYSGSHTHTYQFVWYEGAHPHQNYEQCTSCGDLRGMGTYAATYTNTFYEKAHPHKYYGTCKICSTGHYTGETEPCNQVGLYYDGNHPHPTTRVFACGATELTGGYEPCNQVGLYYDGNHPHPRYREFACGATEFTGGYEACNQVGLYYDGNHPHPRTRVFACGATELTGGYEPCNQVGLYYDGNHPHPRTRVFACGATEFTGGYEPCSQVAIYPDAEHPHRRYRVYACGATEYLNSYGECTCS